MRRTVLSTALVMIALLTCPLGRAQRAGIQENEKPRQQEAAEERLAQLASRANAMLEILASMEGRLRRDGLTLRADLLQRRQRLEQGMDEAEAKLKKGQLAEARKAMNRAQVAVEYLERQVGGK
jgi:hypothetical protein